jgi:putative phosphoribosyl transferase
MSMAVSHKLKVLSHSDQPFAGRVEAGELLARSLQHFKGPQTIVLGIPSGGVVVAREVAIGLDAPLDIVLSRKLRAPGNPELAIGAIAENGNVFQDPHLVRMVGADKDYLSREEESQFAHIQERSEVYRRVRSKIDLMNKDVIVVDDGVATGATVQAAFWCIAQEKPRKLIGAFPIGSEDVLHRLCERADEIICLRVPSYLSGVGRFYFDFKQVSENGVLGILEEYGKKP